jgi:hypothetical protein
MSVFSGSNPKKNKRLDMLRKPEILLLGFTAGAYPEKTGAIDIVKEMTRKLAAQGPRRDRMALAHEMKDRLRSAASDVFGTEQQPFVLYFGAGPFVMFIPDLMSADELQAFRQGVMIQGLKLAKVFARKTEGSWHFELSNRPIDE